MHHMYHVDAYGPTTGLAFLRCFRFGCFGDLGWGGGGGGAIAVFARTSCSAGHVLYLKANLQKQCVDARGVNQKWLPILEQ